MTARLDALDAYDDAAATAIREVKVAVSDLRWEGRPGDAAWLGLALRHMREAQEYARRARRVLAEEGR